MTNPWRWVPNSLSTLRLILVPVVLWHIWQDHAAMAFILCVMAGVTDGLDGWIARRFDAGSRLGAMLDPLADKALMIGVYGALALKAWVPLWLVVLVVIRDLGIVAVVALSHLLGRPQPVRPLMISRINTAMQIVLAAWLLASRGFAIQDGTITLLLVYVVALTTLVSAVAYLMRWRQGWRGRGTR